MGYSWFNNRGDLTRQLQYLNSYDIHRVLFKAWWLRWRNTVGFSFIVAGVVLSSYMACGDIDASVFTCKDIPAWYWIVTKLMAVIFYGLMIYTMRSLKVFRKTGRMMPCIISVMVMPALSHGFGSYMYTLPILTMPLIISLLFYGGKQIRQIVSPC